jgi:ABC-type sugar transport system ATPase subunit
MSLTATATATAMAPGADAAPKGVELRHVSKRFGSVEVINDLDLTVEKGSFTALLGPSGCGKSTLLRMIAGLEQITEGQCLIDGIDVSDTPPAKRRIAMVFQSYALYPHMTVRQNIAFSLSIAGHSRAAQKARVGEVAHMLQLDTLLDRRPAQLSGGQRQRVAIGRALVRDPIVFLFDEPLSNLDALLRVQMRLELAKLHKALGTTMIYVTHDQVEAMTLADKIVVLDKGRISQIGTPLDLYNRPANKFVASFIGSPGMNFLPANVVASTANAATVALPGGRSVGISLRTGNEKIEGVEIGVRPEHVKLVDGNDPAAVLEGTIAIVEHLGNSTILYVDTAAGQLIIEAEGNLRVAAGTQTGVALDGASAHLFGANGLVL